jgi:hypothetical protein
MVSDAKIMRARADKYRRLADQQSRPDKREKYRAYARIYSEMAIRFELHHELGWKRMHNKPGEESQGSIDGG